MLLLDGVYVDRPNGSARLRWIKASTSAELTQLAYTIADCVGRYLERLGLLHQPPGGVRETAVVHEEW